jgi:glycosyltransferase involved in cell wall biosynthesis
MRRSTCRVARAPNVKLVGAQPYADLPAWAKAFDVAIIPYRHNRQVENANPLKLREYLATGKPVVSVSNPEIDKFARWVRIAEGREAFLAELENALRDDSPSRHRARRRGRRSDMGSSRHRSAQASNIALALRQT